MKAFWISLICSMGLSTDPQAECDVGYRIQKAHIAIWDLRAERRLEECPHTYDFREVVCLESIAHEELDKNKGEWPEWD